jgi:hypothetical protein
LIENIIVHGTRPSNDGFGFGFDNYFIDQLFRSFNDYARDAVADFAIGVASAVAEAVAEQAVNQAFERVCDSLRSAAEPFRGVVDALLAAAATNGTNPETLSFLIGGDAGAAYGVGAGGSGGLILAGDGRVGGFKSVRFTSGVELALGVTSAIVPTSSIAGASVIATGTVGPISVTGSIPGGTGRGGQLGGAVDAQIKVKTRVQVPFQATVGVEVTEAFLCPN